MKQTFHSLVTPPEEYDTPALWFTFSGPNLLIVEGTPPTIPQIMSPSDLGLQSHHEQYLGTLGGQHCFLAELEPDLEPPTGMALSGLRDLFGNLDDDHASLASKAIQLIAWRKTHQFCGRCGTKTELMTTERAMKCPNCNLTGYPRISPCIIVRVTRGDEILLARGPRWQPGWFSVLAGFIEPGETAEEAVEREILEEVGIQVKDIRYFSSQSWPFPNSLMLGFTAEYEAGTLTLQPDEILEADWFTRDTMPNVPSGKISIAGRLIENYLAS
ncbi:MAG: NAD(+) diphosphatase [Chloroflexota bacterium]